jgi:hypothetical protein
MPAPPEKFVDCPWLPFDLDEDRAVRLIAGKAGQAEAKRFPAGGLPEIHALDKPVNTDIQMRCHLTSRRCSLQKKMHPSGPTNAACSTPPGMISLSPGKHR